MVSFEIDFIGACGGHPAAVLAAGEVPEPVAHRAEPRIQVLAVPAQQVGEGADAGLVERCLRRPAPTPQISRTGLSRRKAAVSAWPITEKPRGLSRSEATLARNLLWRQADGTGQAEFVLHPFRQPGQHHGGRGAVQAGGAGQVEERLVQRQGFDGGGELVHHRADLRARLRHRRPSGACTTTASGQSFSAWNIGMAERTPLMRAM